jgi:hypothetical protein
MLCCPFLRQVNPSGGPSAAAHSAQHAHHDTASVPTSAAAAAAATVGPSPVSQHAQQGTDEAAKACASPPTRGRKRVRPPGAVSADDIIDGDRVSGDVIDVGRQGAGAACATGEGGGDRVEGAARGAEPPCEVTEMANCASAAQGAGPPCEVTQMAKRASAALNFWRQLEVRGWMHVPASVLACLPVPVLVCGAR